MNNQSLPIEMNDKFKMPRVDKYRRHFYESFSKNVKQTVYCGKDICTPVLYWKNAHGELNYLLIRLIERPTAKRPTRRLLFRIHVNRFSVEGVDKWRKKLNCIHSKSKKWVSEISVTAGELVEYAKWIAALFNFIDAKERGTIPKPPFTFYYGSYAFPVADYIFSAEGIINCFLAGESMGLNFIRPSSTFNFEVDNSKIRNECH